MPRMLSMRTSSDAKRSEATNPLNNIVHDNDSIAGIAVA